MSIGMRRFSVMLFFAMSLCITTPSNADVIDFFDTVTGTADGEFGWDEFGLTGSSYEGPHLPDQFAAGTGGGSLTINSGGLITTTNNLYSFFSVANWQFGLSGLSTDESFTSVAFQFATSFEYDASQFTLNGSAPDEFFGLGKRTEIGGFGYSFYWAEWQGLNASNSYSVQLAGTGQHQSLAGAKASYFNTANSAFNITAVPEPSAMLVLVVLGFASLAHRQR
ncbi:MAG: hypothetical protein AAFN77_19310 [Planctomycetota bacterium]